MKKLLAVLAMVLLFTVPALADVPFHNANQATLSWDAVTTDVDGDPITGVTYKLWLANADTDPNKSNAVEVWDGAETQATITLGVKARYYVGVQAWLDDLHSIINWADEIEGQEDADLFGLRYAVPPHGPRSLVKE